LKVFVYDKSNKEIARGNWECKDGKLIITTENPAKQWTKEYTAALTSELLGLVRGKYTVVNIPGAETTLNFADLISRGQAMQKELREKLRLLVQKNQIH
jgi:hypothetical protein